MDNSPVMKPNTRRNSELENIKVSDIDRNHIAPSRSGTGRPCMRANLEKRKGWMSKMRNGQSLDDQHRRGEYP